LTTTPYWWHYNAVKATKAMTIRLLAEQAEALETVANVEQRPVSDVIRAAITEHIESRKSDPGFQKGLKERLQRAQKMLNR
jgi:predicted transcriptional regulator